MQVYNYVFTDGVLEREPVRLLAKSLDDVSRLIHSGKPWHDALQDAADGIALAPLLAIEDEFYRLRKEFETSQDASTRLTEILNENQYLAVLIAGNGFVRPSTDEPVSQCRSVIAYGLESMRQQYLDAGVQTSVNGIVLDCREQDIPRWTGALSLHREKASSSIVVADKTNQIHELTMEQFETVYTEIGDHYEQSFGIKWNLRQSLQQAETIDELKIVFEVISND